jgi:hypothetical protein
MDAELLSYFKEDFEDGTIMEVVIWKVPSNKERPHGLKYRLHFGKLDGTCIIRYDNEKGKGDHRHIGNKEAPYRFVSTDKLLADFRADIHKYKRRAK